MLDFKKIDNTDITMPVPDTDPQRQYYYMKKCKEWAESEKKRIGRKLRMHVETLGCQMNVRDSEKMSAILEYIGYTDEPDEIPDIVLYNTCTVRENANAKIYGHLGMLKSKKDVNPSMKIILCGCMMQEEDEAQKIKKSYPFVDIVFGTHNIYKLAELLYENIVSDDRVMDIWEKPGDTIEDLPSKRKYAFKAGVNIMYGCNNFCTYCIVPYVRGKERSRRPDDIISEIKGLVSDGVVEVMLLGQNVNSYAGGISFAKLLRRVNDIDGLKRIRFMTSHPKDLSDDLIKAMAECDKVCDHLHLPLQSGSSDVLRRMNRHYSADDYMRLVYKIRERMPDISLTTDIIVGFPGESDKDFEDTLDIVKKVRYDSAYTFIYSKRTGTPAADMANEVPQSVTKERFNTLLDTIKDIAVPICESRVGEVHKVLFEKVNKKDASLITGRLSNNCLVHAKGDSTLIGKIADVKLTKSMGFYYYGEKVG